MREIVVVCITAMALVWCAEAQGKQREIGIEVKPGYRHQAAVALFKRNLRLQGWRVTDKLGAHWQVKLCPPQKGSSQICMRQGYQWMSFRGPQKALGASTRARLFLLYFNMLQQSGKQASASQLRSCGCRAKSQKQRQTKRRPRHRDHPRNKRKPRTRAHPKKQTKAAPAPTKPLRVEPVMLPVKRKPPAARIKVASGEFDDDFSDMEMTKQGKSLEQRKPTSWPWWFAVGVSGDIYWMSAAPPPQPEIIGACTPGNARRHPTPADGMGSARPTRGPSLSCIRARRQR